MTTSHNKPEYIQLEANEDVASIRDRLSFIRGKRVLLIWPETGTALTRKLDLVLVQREARRRAIQVALVTHDENVIQHAQELQISTFETIKSSEHGRWKRGRTRVFVQRYHKPEAEPEPEDLMNVASRIRGSRVRHSRVRIILERIIVMILLSLVLVGVSYALVPSATVKISIVQEIISTEVVITADPDPAVNDINLENRIIPATILRAPVQETRTIETTGIQKLDDLPAVGSVVFTNLTNQPVDIPANTIVSTSTGNPVYYKTVNSGRLPAGAGEQLTLNIEAQPESYGEIGNVGASLINRVEGDLSTVVSVQNVTPITGGESRTIRIVTQDDMDRLRLTVNGELQQAAFAEMQASITENQHIIPETLFIPPSAIRSDWIIFDHQVGDVSDTLSLNMRSIVEAVAIDDRFARQIVFAALSSQKPRNLLLLPETYIYNRGEILSVDADNRIMMNATGEVRAVGQLRLEELKEKIAGKSIEEARQILANEANIMISAPIEITVSPAWLNQLPFLPIRIDMIVENLG